MLPVNASAAEKVVDAGMPGQGSVSLTEYFAVLEDPGQILTLADVLTPVMASRFSRGQTPTEALSYGFTRSAYWLRLDLRNDSSQPIERMLEISYPILSSIQFYQPKTDGSYQAIITGVATPFSTRPYPNRLFVFPLTLQAHTGQVLYLRIQTASSMLIPAKLWEPQAFYAHERDNYTAQAWYFGMASAMILFNLFLYLALRDAAYLWYCCFAICTALTISVSNGLGKEFIWPDTILWSDIAVSVFGSLTLATLLIFMRHLLSTCDTVPKVDGLIKAFIAILLLFPVGFFISAYTFALPASLFIFLTGILILSTGIFCAFFKQQHIALFFILAVSLWITGVFMVSMKTINVLPVNIVTMNGYQIGSALEMLVLAFALAYRFNLIRRQATEDVQRANVSLEQRLQEREEKLTASHQRLREIEHRQTLSEERQRLMQDIHDGLGSSLTSALRVVEHGKLNEAEVAQVLKSCIDDLKLAIDSMEPVDADLLLLLATLRFRLGPRLESTGIDLRWEVKDVPKLEWLAPKTALHILRILQEAFTNVIKHTHATEIHVATGVEGDHVVVKVSDNGHGFSFDSTLKGDGKGLSNQKRRAEAIGAEVGWDSNNAGTCFTLRVPIHQPGSNPD